MTQLWTIASAIEQIERCAFECEAGPLTNNSGWQFIVAQAKIGPKFAPGQGIWFRVDAEAAGRKLTQWVHFYVVGLTMASDTERRLWVYDLSYDPPGPWHYGVTHFKGVSEARLFLDKPPEVEPADDAQASAA